MRELKLIYTEAGIAREMKIILTSSMRSPLIGGALTLSGVVAVIDSTVTGIIR